MSLDSITRPCGLHFPYQQLLSYDPAKSQAVGSFKLSILPEAQPSINCFQALDYLCVLSLTPLSFKF